MVAKYRIDVKRKTWVFYGANAIALRQLPGCSLVRPPLSPFPSYPSSILLFLLAYADREGHLEPREGWWGELTAGEVTCLAEDTIWILEDGQVVQRFVPGLELLSRRNDLNNPVGHHKDPDVVGSTFHTGIFGADRALAQAGDKVLTELQAFKLLNELSDDALEHAIGTNLRDDTSITEHDSFIAELTECAKGTSEIAQEIRVFIARMGSRKDRTNRHNVYRMVMIVRAIQRRSFRVSSHKQVTLKLVTAASVAVANYIAQANTLAGRIVTELSDPHPWWYGEKGNVTVVVGARRRTNFANDLEGYATSLERITADPIRVWAFKTACVLRELVRLLRLSDLATLREEQARVLSLARDAVEMMRFVQYMERVSRAMTCLRSSKGMHGEAVAVIRDVKTWRRANAGMACLGTMPSALLPITTVEEWRMNNTQLIDQLRLTLELMSEAA